ncbi:MAG: nuclear transport factor 2 family protein [Flavobacteriaceae bacterium]
MKTRPIFGLLAGILLLYGCSSNQTNDEQQIRDLIAQYDQAILENNADFFENTLAPNYKILTENGGIQSKDEVLKEIRSEKENPTYIISSVASDSLEINQYNNIAVVTGRWLSGTKSIENPEGEVHNDVGRYTVILEKNNNSWKVISEHISEKPHDKKLLEEQLRKASEGYDKALLSKDVTLFSSLFAKDYTSIDNDGVTKNEKQLIEEMMQPDLVITKINTTDKTFRLYRNTAVETGKYDSEGIFKGKPFVDKGRYTATWVYRDGSWKLVAEHSSNLAK